MNGQGTPVNTAIALVIGNLAYLIFTVILASIIGVAPSDIFSGAFSEAAHSLVSAWVAVGVLLGVVDLLVVAGFFSSVMGGGR